jgi:recA bacterial DNA recombination protein
MTSAASALDWQFQLLDLQPSRPTPTLVPPPPPVEPGQSEALRQLRKALDPSIAAKVRSGAELLRHVVNSDRLASIPTTLGSLDTLLGGGLQRGKLVELVSRRAAGRFSIVMSALAAATSMGEAVALVDLGDHFDPQLAQANGVDLRRLLWVRPRTVKEAVMSAEMITATGFQLVVIDLGLHPVRGRRAPEAAWVRLARTAETSGTAMLVTSPYPVTATASEAVIKGSVARARWIGSGRSPRLLAGIEMSLTLEKHRQMRPGSATKVELQVAELLGCSVAGSHPPVNQTPANPTTRQPGNPTTQQPSNAATRPLRTPATPQPRTASP